MQETAKKKKITTIKISKDTVDALNQLKIHPRQSYEEVILELLGKKGGKKK
jgi:predicted CopG family antitoxin